MLFLCVGEPLLSKAESNCIIMTIVKGYCSTLSGWKPPILTHLNPIHPRVDSSESSTLGLWLKYSLCRINHSAKRSLLDIRMSRILMYPTLSFGEERSVRNERAKSTGIQERKLVRLGERVGEPSCRINHLAKRSLRRVVYPTPCPLHILHGTFLRNKPSLFCMLIHSSCMNKRMCNNRISHTMP